ncbi:outer membrane beta-barrel protein [Methanococcoides sp. SA1]|nr:outer membrane beta-barrel protein [Methanococcoides sp. SA1]
MKKIFSVAAVAILCQTVGVTSSLAGAIDNLHNYSAEYIRTLNRNAATDSADIVAYNPAGVMAMDDGSYVNLSLQYLDKDYKNIIAGGANDGAFSQDTPSIIPGFFALHKKEKWAAFAAVTVPAGGGKVDFAEGSATVQIINENIGGAPILSSRAEGEEVYVGLTLGGAYQVNDNLSFSAGLRHIKADKSTQATLDSAGIDVDVDFESEADGWGGIFGVNYKASDKLNLAARYETRTKLDFEHTVNLAVDTHPVVPGAVVAGVLAERGITNGVEIRRDIPAILGLGLSHQCTPALKVDVNLTYYFNEDANWAGDENDVDNGYEFGIALEYAVNERLRVSGGYMYTETGIDVEDTVAESPKLDVNTFGGGFAYALKDNLELNVGLGISLYDDDSYIETTATGDLAVGYEKEVIFYSTGLQYSF